VPADVKLLGYYARQIEVGVASKDPEMLARGRSDLVASWEQVERAISGRVSVAEVRSFNDIVVQLMSAKAMTDYLAPARAAQTASARWENILESER